VRHGCARGTEQCRPANGNTLHIRGGRGSQWSQREEGTSRNTLWSPQRACQQAVAENLGNSAEQLPASSACLTRRR